MSASRFNLGQTIKGAGDKVNTSNQEKSSIALQAPSGIAKGMAHASGETLARPRASSHARMVSVKSI